MASEVSEEAQALLVLRRWHEMPGLGIQLVPEHVETRPLYHPRSPGLLQVREGLAPNPGTPGPRAGPGPWTPRMPIPQDLHLGTTLLLWILAPDPGPQHPHSSLGLPTPNLDSGPAGFPSRGHQGSFTLGTANLTPGLSDLDLRHQTLLWLLTFHSWGLIPDPLT